MVKNADKHRSKHTFSYKMYFSQKKKRVTQSVHKNEFCHWESSSFNFACMDGLHFLCIYLIANTGILATAEMMNDLNKNLNENTKSWLKYVFENIIMDIMYSNIDINSATIMRTCILCISNEYTQKY